MLKTQIDILWLLLCSGLVFFMQAGFLCLESGLTRTKNSINVAIKNITDFGLATLIYYSFGFGLMYGSSSNGIIGVDNFFPKFSFDEPQVPVFFIFQLMFCGTAATIVSGAVAERMRFGAYLITTSLITLAIYPVFGHWAWGKNLMNWTSLSGWLGNMGFVDFAGSTVVHSVGGWVALVAMIIIGPRNGKYLPDGTVKQITGHNLPIAMLGTMILWFGWIGFNGGSTLSFSTQIPDIIANTMLSAAGGLVSALCYGWYRLKYAEATLPLNGALAGLVSITASCHAVASVEAVIIGMVAGILMFETRLLLDRFKLDDAVGAIPVHLSGGIWGTLAVGIFADTQILKNGLDTFGQIKVQVLGIISCAGVSLGTSIIILGFVNRFFNLRVSEKSEAQGLNYAEHKATTELTDLFLEMEYQKRTGNLDKDVSVEPFTEVGQIAERYNLVLQKIRQTIKEKEAVTLDLEKNLNIIHNDLLTAKRIQTTILSQNKLHYEGMEITVKYLPLTEVGGDFFDIKEIRPGLTRIFFADSTGHGVQAALMTMALKAIYDSLKKDIYSVNEILFLLNNEYLDSFETLNQFVTCILVDIDTKNKTLKYASAGHIPQLLISGNSFQRLEKTGRIIGAIRDSKYRSVKLDISNENRILLYSDGLIEEWNSSQEEFGEKRLEDIIINSKLPMKILLDEILNEQERFLSGSATEDDIALIGVDII